ncbi:hypothetical protein BDN72DRAFT_862492 [Pluteus cervinus]|uniref:Uncharacterized protein n=1 Tax=Pluteus cervinus TaxID=181527 RepID=A0ACD3ABB5_9AGAR|nr:hypothetical protein BDN72DRAFT_862492 [Pluteus cervinus]
MDTIGFYDDGKKNLIVTDDPAFDPSKALAFFNDATGNSYASLELEERDRTDIVTESDTVLVVVLSKTSTGQMWSVEGGEHSKTHVYVLEPKSAFATMSITKFDRVTVKVKFGTSDRAGFIEHFEEGSRVLGQIGTPHFELRAALSQEEEAPVMRTITKNLLRTVNEEQTMAMTTDMDEATLTGAIEGFFKIVQMEGETAHCAAEESE